MVDDGSGFFDHRHNKAVAMRIFHGGRFGHLRMLTKIKNFLKSEKNGGSGGATHCDDAKHEEEAACD